MDLKGKVIASTRLVLNKESLQIIFEDGTWIVTGLDPWSSADLVPPVGEPVEKTEEVKEEKTVVVEETKETTEPVEEKKETTSGSDDDYYTKEEFEDMDRAELCEIIIDEELKIDPEDYKKTSKLRKKLIEELV